MEPDMKDIKIVVVEDEADIREVIDHNLSREGYMVDSAADGVGEKEIAILGALGSDAART